MPEMYHISALQSVWLRIERTVLTYVSGLTVNQINSIKSVGLTRVPAVRARIQAAALGGTP
jgi:hypothetical protein